MSPSFPVNSDAKRPELPDVENQRGSISSIRSKDNVQYWAVVACGSYCLCSMFMTFSNKLILSASGYGFSFPISVLLYQHIFSVFVIKLASALKLITIEPIVWSTAQKWLPLNILFVAMLMSGTYTLSLLSVPMVTIFKNLTTMLITVGDRLFFDQTFNIGVGISLFLMSIGSLVAGWNDLEFRLDGYVWMMFNCVVSACYILFMRYAMKGTKLSEFGSVYYNNFLSIPLLIPLIIISGEIPDAAYFEGWNEPGFLSTITFSGISSICISFTSFWAVKATSPTTYRFS
eukprot:TRINITY_DN7373_c0_g2_i1.p1 TRINITY_DN7373_c0_g2~~TRINITY_DN7373_c0_g2_i1.p1  ORF type:complete len:288 (-),score=32.47 TRINITY_DN7373_c0_g2_i1:220-1083(-)